MLNRTLPWIVQRKQGGERLVQRDQLSLPPDGQPKKIGIRQLPVSDEVSNRYLFVVQSKIVCPENVMLVPNNLIQHMERLLWQHGFQNDLRV
jgi:hypothetical protein